MTTGPCLSAFGVTSHEVTVPYHYPQCPDEHFLDDLDSEQTSIHNTPHA